jgi:hypothetical protein
MGLPASRQPTSGLVPREHQHLAAAGNAPAQACDAPPSSRSPVASKTTTTANVPDNRRRHDRPPRRQMTASTAS